MILRLKIFSLVSGSFFAILFMFISFFIKKSIIFLETFIKTKAENLPVTKLKLLNNLTGQNLLLKHDSILFKRLNVAQQ